jgi:hypothetical protein
MKTNMQMKPEQLSDDDIPFKTLFPNAFKVKMEPMKTTAIITSAMIPENGLLMFVAFQP